MVNTTDHIAYSSAEALLLDYIQNHPTGEFWETNWWQWSTWGLLLIYMIVGVLTFYYLRRSRDETAAIRHLTTLISGSLLLNKTAAFELRHSTTIITTPSYWIHPDILKTTKEHADYAHLPLTALILLLVIFLFLILWWQGKRRSYVFLDIGNRTGQVLIKLARLPNNSQQFKVQLTSRQFFIQNFCVFAVLRLHKPWTATNVLTGKVTTLSDWAIVSWRAKRQLDKIMRADNLSALKLLVHTHSYEYDSATKRWQDKQRKKLSSNSLNLSSSTLV